MLEQLVSDLTHMALCWGMGLFTGLGLGTALASQRFAKERSKWMA